MLSTSAASLELWLRTLITITPQQCTNLELHDATPVLSLLSSGEVWVGRGNGLFIDLDLTLRGQPLSDEQLRELSEAILDAPVSTLNALGSVSLTNSKGLDAVKSESVVTLRHCPRAGKTTGVGQSFQRRCHTRSEATSSSPFEHLSG